MKLKILSMLVAAISIVLILTGCSAQKASSSAEDKNIYVIFNEGLTYSNMQFSESMLGFEPVSLDKQIGETSDGKQVFSIKDMNPEEYICLRVEGEEKVFQNSRIFPLSDIKELNINKIVVRNDENIEDSEIIIDKKTIEALLHQLVDENIVTDEVVGEIFKDFTLYSERLPGVCYKYSYVVDEFGDEYIYDANLGCAWKFTEKLFEID